MVWKNGGVQDSDEGGEEEVLVTIIVITPWLVYSCRNAPACPSNPGLSQRTQMLTLCTTKMKILNKIPSWQFLCQEQMKDMMNNVFLLFLLLFTISNSLHAQTCEVLSLTGKAKVDGMRIKEGYKLSYTGVITVKEKSVVLLENSTGWYFELETGTYKLDSCYASLSKKYFRFDSIVYALHRTGCKLKHPVVCGTDYYGAKGELYYSQGYIGITKAEYNAAKDSVLIEWKDPKPYKGSYIVRFYNLYDEPVACEFSGSCLLTIPSPTQDGEGYTIEVITQDCRMSNEEYVREKK